jgi:hypothetical protein
MSEHEIDAEKLIENIEKFGSAEGDPNAAKEASAPVPSETAAPEATAAAAQPVSPGFSFKSMDELLKHQLEFPYKGKQIKEDLATILKRASSGYDYAQKMNGFNQERSEWEKKVQEAQALNQKWSRFDEYAKQNPDWYNHWENAWQNRGQNLTEAPAADSNIEAKINALLESRLAPVNELISQQEQQKQRMQVDNEDRELSEQIESIRKSYPNLDFDRTDPESGKSLEYKIMEFATQNGIKRFDHAFRAFYHDELVKLEREAAKDALSRETQAKTKAGIVPQGTAPQKAPPSLKGMNYEHVTELAARELGIQL